MQSIFKEMKAAFKCYGWHQWKENYRGMEDTRVRKRVMSWPCCLTRFSHPACSGGVYPSLALGTLSAALRSPWRPRAAHTAIGFITAVPGRARRGPLCACEPLTELSGYGPLQRAPPHPAHHALSIQPKTLTESKDLLEQHYGLSRPWAVSAPQDQSSRSPRGLTWGLSPVSS